MATVQPITPERTPEVARFLADFPGEKRPLDYWRRRAEFWWEANPACAPDTPRGFVLDHQGEVVGFVGNVPTYFMLEGQPTRVVNATGWKVLEAFRDQSLMIWFSLLGAARGSILFCTTPNDVALKVLEGLKFRPFPGPRQRSFFHLNFRRPLEVRLGAGLLSRAGAALLGAIQGLRLGNLKLPSGLDAAREATAGPSLDALWDRTRAHYALTNRRSALDLNWYVSGLTEAAKELWVCRRGGLAVGLAITRRVGKGGDAGLEVLDFWADPTVEGVLAALAAAIITDAKERGLDIVFWHHFTPDLGRDLERLGVGRVKTVEYRYFYRCAAPLAARLEDPEATYLCGLQGDVGL